MARFMRRKCVQLRSSLEKIFLHNNFSLTTVVTSPLPMLCISEDFFCENSYFYTGSNFYKVDPWKIKAPQGDLWIFRGWSWWSSIVTQHWGKMWNILKGEWFWSLISGLQCSYHRVRLWWWKLWRCLYDDSGTYMKNYNGNVNLIWRWWWRWEIRQWQLGGKRSGVGEVLSRVTQWQTNVGKEKIRKWQWWKFRRWGG